MKKKILQRSALTVFSSFLLFQLFACDLFSTRPSEPPLDGGTPWFYPTQVNQLFQNMSQAILEMNSEHYMRCFFGLEDTTHSFLFLPSPYSANNWPITLPDVWGYTDEQQSIQYLFSLMNPSSPGSLILQEEGRTTYGNEDSVWVVQHYELHVPNSQATLIPEDVTGRADFYLAKNSTGYWAIYRWEDREESPSWTDLKAVLYY